MENTNQHWIGDITVDLSITNQCQLIVIDNTDYQNNLMVNDLENHIILNFLVYNYYDIDKQISPVLDSITIIEGTESDPLINHIRDPYLYDLRKDGYYTFYKYLISKVDHINGNQLEGAVFYANGNIYVGNQNLSDDATDIDKISNSTEITNYYELKNYMTTGIEHYISKDLFTICKLNRCLMSLQKKMIYDNLKNKCTYDKCSSNEETRLQRNFIFDSVYILTYLINTGAYLEAQRIIEDLSTCNYVCDNLLNLTYNNCNCGTTI